MSNNLSPNLTQPSTTLLVHPSLQDELDFCDRPSVLSSAECQNMDLEKDIRICNSDVKDSDTYLPFKQNLRLSSLTCPLELNRNESSTDSATPNWQDAQEKATLDFPESPVSFVPRLKTQGEHLVELHVNKLRSCFKKCTSKTDNPLVLNVL